MAHNNQPNYALHSYGRYRFWKPLIHTSNAKLIKPDHVRLYWGTTTSRLPWGNSGGSTSLMDLGVPPTLGVMLPSIDGVSS